MAENLDRTPAVADWSTQKFVPPCYSWPFAYYVQDVDFSDDGSYFAVGANGGREANAYCDAVSRWETSARGSNLDATWVDYTGTDTVTSVEATQNVIYTGGHFRWMNNANGNDAAGPGAIDRYGIAALDPSNGVPFNWNPTRSPGGARFRRAASWGAQVNVIWKGSDGIYVGHDSDGLGNEYHGRMGCSRPRAAARSRRRTRRPRRPATCTCGHRRSAHQGARSRHDGRRTTLAQPNIAGIGRRSWSPTGSTGPRPTPRRRAAGWCSRSSGRRGQRLVAHLVQRLVQVGALNGAFSLNGRMYYVRNNNLYYRYLEHDGNTFGCHRVHRADPERDVDRRAGPDLGRRQDLLRQHRRQPALGHVRRHRGRRRRSTAPPRPWSPADGINWYNQTLYFATS